MKKYISRYSNNKVVSAAQYITEIICEHKAKKDKQDLHYKFWEHKQWSVFYKNQIASANKLLKQYDAKAIVNALNSTQAQKIYSLRAPHLVPMIEQEQQRLNSATQSNIPIKVDRKDNIAFNRNHRTNKNIISKLRDLE